MAARLNNSFWELVRFVIVGGFNTIVGLGAIFGAIFFFDLGNVAANALGYAVGLTVSFVLNSQWTFRFSGSVLKAAIPFLVAFAISYAVNLSVVLALVDWFHVNSYLAQTAGILPYTACFYLLSKFVVFRSQAHEIPMDR